MGTLKQFHGLPCICYTKRQILGVFPSDNCPSICGTDINIVGVSNNYTVDGWYLQEDASNLVYMESNVITQTVPCSSGITDLIISIGGSTAAPAVFHNGAWSPLIITELTDQVLGLNFKLATTIEDWFTNDCTGVCQISEDAGVTWTTVGTMDNSDLISGTPLLFDTTAMSYIYRVVITDTVTGCQFYNPAPDTGSPAYGIYYAKIDFVDPLFELLGSINAINPLDVYDTYLPLVLATMADPYQTVDGRIGGIGINKDAGLNGVPFYLQIISPVGSTPTELAVVLDSSGTPVDTSVQGTSTVVRNYVATYTFLDITKVIIDGFTLFGVYITIGDIAPTDPLFDAYVRTQFEVFQIADPAFSFSSTVTSTQVILNLTSAAPFESVSFDEYDYQATTVPLIEI